MFSVSVTAASAAFLILVTRDGLLSRVSLEVDSSLSESCINLNFKF